MGTSDQKRFYIVDGHALAYRAFFAFVNNPLMTGKGQNVSAIFGFARMLLNLIRNEAPDFLAVAFDPPGKSFRAEIYPDYKATRAKMPDDMRGQVEEIRSMIDVLGIRRLEYPTVEADDILGTVARRFASPELAVVIVTGDKDAYQLVNENVSIYANKKGIVEHEWYDTEGVRAKIGLDPSQVIDYMALMGDASDNVPGVKGIGEKTALSLLQRYPTLENIYANIDDIKGRQKVLLEEGKEMAFLSRKLVTIKTDCDLDLLIDDCAFTFAATPSVIQFFRSLEMDSIIRDYFAHGDTGEAVHQPVAPVVEKKYETIFSLERLGEVAGEVSRKGIVSIDTETTAIHPNDADLVGISLSFEAGRGWYVPLLSGGLFGQGALDRDAALGLLRPLIESSQVRKVGQNIKYDLIVLARSGIKMEGIYFDTMVASYVLNPEERRHNMDDLAGRYLNYKTITYKELVGTGKNAVAITDVPLEKIAEYAIEDADITWRLYEKFSVMLKEENLEKLFFDLEMPLVSVLARMEYHGVAIDREHFKKIAAENDRRLDSLVKEIYASTGVEFNLNSTRELASVLFDRLGLKSVKKTQTGQSTDISVLEALKGDHPVIDLLIEYRTLAKLKNTYIDTLPLLVSERTGRIHTSYNQTVVATGRLSSSDPNLQNIPVKNEFGRSIRRGFIAADGFRILSADYSQIELRLAAHLSGDENMIQAFLQGTDIHSLTASRVFGVPVEEVDAAMRRQAKIINFATIYGVSPWGLSKQADIGVKEAETFIKIYFETYPGFRAYITRTIEFAREHGYVETLLGRRRRIPDIDSSAVFRREGAERVAINTPIQGTSADMIKRAMITIDEGLALGGFTSRMIMQVHDELVFEVNESESEAVSFLVRDRMEKALELAVPVVVDMGYADSWEEAH